ncbi:MAG: hypothetical protein BIFFINMI_03903 [Phycisphaerae bacterium]|nr:hypothetical protein [Phycisphaerae bacterium]
MADYFDPHVIGRIKNFEIRSLRLVESYMAGMHKSRLLGISTEFAQHRQYVAGDDTKHLDWKVYAKTDRFYVKQYEAETNMRVYFLLDTSNSMHFAGDGAAMSKFDYGATLVASISYLLMQQKDTFGLLLFDEEVRAQLPPKGSHSHFRNLTGLLSAAKPGGQTDIGKALSALAPQMKGRGLVFVISDFLADTDALNLGMGQMSFGNHDVSMFHVRDPQERDFPFRGQTIFIGPEQEGRLLCEPRDLRNAYIRAQRRHESELRQMAMRFGFDVERIDTDARLDDSLSKFLAERLARRRKGR